MDLTVKAPQMRTLKKQTKKEHCLSIYYVLGTSPPFSHQLGKLGNLILYEKTSSRELTSL